MTTVLEKKIEEKVNDYAKKFGIEVYKFSSPNRAAVPDRMFVYPNGTVLFIEFKREGEKPTVPQLREHARLRGQNVPVYVVDNVQDGVILIDHFRSYDSQLTPDTSWWL